MMYELKATVVNWQEVMVEWVKSRLGEKAMDPHERGLRFVEEAIELAQAVDISEGEVEHIVKHVFDKEPGRIEQEIGGVVATLLPLSESQNVSMSIAGLMEIDRIHSLPPEEFVNRQKQNAADGIGAPRE